MPISTHSRRGLAFAAAIFIAWPIIAHARDYAVGALRIERPWSRPAAAGVNGAGYLTLVNSGKTPDALIAADSPAAARVTLHSSRMAHGVMSMRPLAALAIAPGATVTLAPGGYHLMLEGLKRPLKSGDRIPATLTFSHAGKVTVEFLVQAGADPMAGMKM